MKPLLLVSISLFFSIIGFSQKESKINVQDTCYRKQGYWIYYGKDRPNSGIPPDGKVEEGRYVDSRKEGTWIRYHQDGKTPKIIGNYQNNRPVGQFKKFDESGLLIEKGTFSKTIFCDSLIKWYSNGQLKYVAFFNNEGHEQGQVTYYYENGVIELTYFAENGIPKNEIHFTQNGDTLQQYKRSDRVFWTDAEKEKYEPSSSWVNAKKHNQKPPFADPTSLNSEKKILSPNSYNTLLNADKEKWQEGTFKDGQLWDGKVYIYDRDGILLKVEVYKSGLYHSDGQL